MSKPKQPFPEQKQPMPGSEESRRGEFSRNVS